MASTAQLAQMDNQGRVPPAQAVYSDLLAVSYPAKKRSVEFTCSNGDTFTSNNNVLEIPIAVGGAEWLDLGNSYLKITIKNLTATPVGFKSPHDIIERLQILGTDSTMIEDVQNYNNLARMLCVHQLGNDGWQYNTNLGEFQTSTLNNDTNVTPAVAAHTDVAGSDVAALVNSVNAVLTDLNTKIETGIKGAVEAGLDEVTGNGNAIGNGSHHGQTNYTKKLNAAGQGAAGESEDTMTICFPLISGICSSGKYLPLGMLKNRSLTLRIQLARGVKAFVADTNLEPVVQYSGVSFVSDVITMAETYNEKFMNMLRSVGDIAIHYTTYKNYPDNVTGAAGDKTYNGLIPDSSRSLKSIFSIFNKQAEANQGDSLQLINPRLKQYQYTVLSETMPQKDVLEIGVRNRNQVFANLHIALGQLGSISSRCMGTADAFYNSNTASTCADNSSTFALGVCVESHNKSSNLLESGKNLQNSTQPCRLRAVINNNSADLTVQHYTLSDRLLTITETGDLRSSG